MTMEEYSEKEDAIKRMKTLSGFQKKLYFGVRKSKWVVWYGRRYKNAH